jgi:hypothetical protein
MSHFIYCYAECHYAECRYAECRGAQAIAVLPPRNGKFKDINLKITIGYYNYRGLNAMPNSNP